MDWHTLLIWAIVGLVAGFLANHVMLTDFGFAIDVHAHEPDTI